MDRRGALIDRSTPLFLRPEFVVEQLARRVFLLWCITHFTCRRIIIVLSPLRHYVTKLLYTSTALLLLLPPPMPTNRQHASTIELLHPYRDAQQNGSEEGGFEEAVKYVPLQQVTLFRPSLNHHFLPLTISITTTK